MSKMNSSRHVPVFARDVSLELTGDAGGEFSCGAEPKASTARVPQAAGPVCERETYSRKTGTWRNSSFVSICEVGPRDGLQSEKKILRPEVVVEFIERLEETGLSIIEVGSFVSPKAVPQMANTKTIFQQLKQNPKVRHLVLVPNWKGFEEALSVGVQDIAVFTAVSDSFTKANIGCTVEESLTRFKPIYEAVPQHKIRVKAYISCAMGCPYEGPMAVRRVAQLAKRLYDMGSDTICLADTIGVGKPPAVSELVSAVVETGIPVTKISLHLHDTLERLALQKIERGLEMGVRIVDSSVGNLGGCPYAPGASGNIATEEVVEKLHALGFKTGVDLQKLRVVKDWILKQIENAS